MTESRVLSNIPYTIHNGGNYDIIAEETRSIVDVPYYPAQNLVDVSSVLNPYAPKADAFIPFYDKNNVHRLFGLMYRIDARFVFIELADNARYVQYKFSGNTYPQSRTDYAYSYDGENLYILGGYANGRCLNDLWKYNIDTNSWSNLNFAFIEQSSNQLPSRRRKSNILVLSDEVLLFGGETDTLTINTGPNVTEFIVPLNDIWSYNTNSNQWTNYDVNRILPHRQGHIIYNSSTEIKIYIIGGINEIGVTEANAIWTINKSTNVATFQSITAPFQPASNNRSISINGEIHVLLSNGSLYKWDNLNSQFLLIRTNIAAVNPIDGYYWTVTKSEIQYGANIGMSKYLTSIAQLYNDSAALQSTKTITLPPVGITIPSINIGNSQTLFFGGMFQSRIEPFENTFNESTYIMNHTTLNVQKFDFANDARPTERVYPALAYDSYRGRVWLYGGFDGTKFYNDLWYFDLGLKTWHLVFAQVEDPNAIHPTPRQKSGMCIVDTHFLYLLGGYSDVNAFNDFWRYNITTGVWNKVYTSENIPWGSQYFIFQWRDRLWLYNGQQLYRYFFDIKQFKAQPFLMGDDSSFLAEDGVQTNQNALLALIRSRKFLDSPVRVTVVNDHMLVQNDSMLFDVDLNTKQVISLNTQYDIKEAVYWLDSYLGIGVSNMCAYYTNISPMQPLTKNQLPNSMYHKTLDLPINNVMMYVDTSSSNKVTYQDISGIFSIQDTRLPLDKATLIFDNDISYAAPASESEISFTEPSVVWDKTIEVLAKPQTYPITPWFQYSNSAAVLGIYQGAQKILYNNNSDRIYIIYLNGNMIKWNPDDNTFFTYHSSLWEGAAFGYNKLRNKIYAFGGIRNQRKVYLQNGMECKVAECEVGDDCVSKELSHSGLLQFDLDINEMNLGSIERYQKEHNVTLVDYTKTRDYLITLIHKYIEGYADNTIPNSIEEVKDLIYTATQPLVDDLSQFDFVFENGIRPVGRAYSANTQVGNKIYIFGGCECVNNGCCLTQSKGPYITAKPGELQNLIRQKTGSGPVFDTDYESRRAACFDMDSDTWSVLQPLSGWRYLASAISSPDETKIFIVGGFKYYMCTQPSTQITIYNIATDSYEELQGIPATYVGRAQPVLRWLDEHRLLIMYGFYTKNTCHGDDCVSCQYSHIPISDSWIYDTQNHVMYKAFKDINIQSSIVAKDTFYVDEQKGNTAYTLSMTPDIDAQGNVTIRADSWDLVHGITTPIKILPSTELQDDYAESPYLDCGTVEGTIELINQTLDIGSITATEILKARVNTGNFRFRYCWIERYGAADTKTMFVVGERTDEAGIDFIEKVAAGYAPAGLRFWYVDLEAPENNRYMHSVVYEYPLPLSPVLIAYDGTRYIYVIYNKYNIWRLDFKSVLKDSTGSYWYQCPPALDANFLGEARTNEGSDNDKWNSFFTRPNYLTLVSDKGRIARMDTDTFVWFLDKEIAPEPPTKGAKLWAGSEIENNEVYLYDLGGISGKVLNIYEKQWDNFFLDMRCTSSLASQYSSVVDSKLFPTFLRRKRMYTINHLGHIYYTWLRIDGEYNVEFQLGDFYDGDEIRVYGDYTLIQNKANMVVDVFGINSGWMNIGQMHFTSVVTENGWDWDGDFGRRYVNVFIDQSGNMAYKYSEMPPNYISIDLAAVVSSEPISKIKVYYKNVPKDFNYMARINKVELLTTQETVNAYESGVAANPLSIINIEPITVNDSFTNQFAVFIKNEGDHPAKDIQLYAFDNDWIQFNLDPTTYPDAWTIRDQTNPLIVAASIDPGSYVIVYVRAVNIDAHPHSKDLVVKGTYSLT